LRPTIIAVLAVAATALGAGCGGDDGAGSIKAPKGTSQSEFDDCGGESGGHRLYVVAS
jgi:hypothetical protein